MQKNFFPYAFSRKQLPISAFLLEKTRTPCRSKCFFVSSLGQTFSSFPLSTFPSPWVCHCPRSLKSTSRFDSYWKLKLRSCALQSLSLKLNWQSFPALRESPKFPLGISLANLFSKDCKILMWDICRFFSKPKDPKSILRVWWQAILGPSRGWLLWDSRFGMELFPQLGVRDQVLWVPKQELKSMRSSKRVFEYFSCWRSFVCKDTNFLIH